MLKIRFGFVKLNTSKGQVTHMLFQNDNSFIRITMPPRSSTGEILHKFNTVSKLETLDKVGKL